MMAARIEAKTVWSGAATAPLALLEAPLSLWGGLDLETGNIADATHPQCGQPIAGRLLAMRSSRGSSSSSSALVEAARRGVAPAAIILTELDPILAIGAIVAQDLYGHAIPIVLCMAEDWPKLVDGVVGKVDAGADGASIFLPAEIASQGPDPRHGLDPVCKRGE